MVSPTLTSPTSPTVHIRPDYLPPPLDGEELVDLNLVVLVRDGSMPLEDEDDLMQEIIDVYRAHGSETEPVYWEAPAAEEFAHDQKGYEIKFNAVTGLPIGVNIVASPQYAPPLFTKSPPRQPRVLKPFCCPLSGNGPLAMKYRRMGYPACPGRGFANFFDWDRHMQTHPDFLATYQRMEDDPNLDGLWEEVEAEADRHQLLRRSVDPRIAEPEPVAE